MKSVLISIQPKWCEKIANGSKTIEVRKSAPKCDVPFKCYIYCTKDKYEWLYRVDNNGYGKAQSFHGKVVGEFVCDRLDTYNFHSGLTEFNAMGLPCRQYGSYLIFADNYTDMCLSYNEVKEYGKGKTLYGWHISDLKIYDKPRELSEFTIPCRVSCESCKNPLYYERKCEEKGVRCISRPPQSYMFVEEVEK